MIYEARHDFQINNDELGIFVVAGDYDKIALDPLRTLEGQRYGFFYYVCNQDEYPRDLLWEYNGVYVHRDSGWTWRTSGYDLDEP